MVAYRELEHLGLVGCSQVSQVVVQRGKENRALKKKIIFKKLFKNQLVKCLILS